MEQGSAHVEVNPNHCRPGVRISLAAREKRESESSGDFNQ